MPVPFDQLLLFLGGSILITVVPGPDMALVFRQVLLGGSGLVWMTLYAHIVQRAHRVLTRTDVRRWLERVTGVVLIGLGLRVALERR